MQPASDNIYSSPIQVSDGRRVLPVCQVDLGRKGDQCIVFINGREVDRNKHLTVDELKFYYRQGIRKLAEGDLDAPRFG